MGPARWAARLHLGQLAMVTAGLSVAGALTFWIADAFVLRHGSPNEFYAHYPIVWAGYLFPLALALLVLRLWWVWFGVRKPLGG